MAMTVEERRRALMQRQRELTPKEDLSPYAGRWVALREGRVVASAVDAASLRRQADVGPDDVLLPVRRHEAGINIF